MLDLVRGQRAESLMRVLRAVTFASLLALAGGVAGADASRRAHFDIAAQALATALVKFSDQAGLQFTAPGVSLGEARSRGVKGEYSTDDALSLLLKDTGFTYSFVDAATVAIRKEGGSVKREADAAPAAGGGLRLAQAESPPTESPAPEEAGSRQAALEEVTVTGSILRTATSVEEIERGAMPIDVITREEIERNPGESVYRILSKQPYFSGYQRNAQNSRQTVGDGDGGESVNLRGMGEKYTQVVLEGRPILGGDIAMLPTEALESVSILTGGASTIYGSGAIAGVVDMKLRKDFEGFQLKGEYGRTSRGDGANRRYSALFGKHTDRFRAVGSVQYLESDGFLRRDRPLAATADLRPWGGSYWPAVEGESWYARSGLYTLNTGAWWDTDPAELMVLDTSRVAPGQTATSAADFRPFDPDRDVDPSAPWWKDAWLEEPVIRKSAHLVAEFDLLDERAQLYAQAVYDAQKGVVRDYNAAIPILYGDNSGVQLLVPADNPYNPFGQAVYVWSYRPSAGEMGRQYRRTSYDGWMGSAGVRGRLGRFRYDVGLNYFHRSGRDRSALQFDWAGNALLESLARTDGSGINLFGNQANTPEQLASVGDVRTGVTYWNINGVDARVSGPILELPGGALNASLAVERRENRRLWDTNAIGWEFIQTPGFRGSLITRTVDAYAGELLAPLYRSGEAGAWLTFVEAGAGTRYEDLRDDGGEYRCPARPCDRYIVGGKGGTNTRISQFTLLAGLFDDVLRLRAAHGGGFISPSPWDLMAPEESFQELVFDPVTGQQVSLLVTRGGNRDLVAEKAANLTWGLSLRPRSLPGFEVSLDFWDVEVEGRIKWDPPLEEVLLGISDVGSVVRDPQTNLPVSADLRVGNGGTLSASGVDVGTRYEWQTQGGHAFRTNLNFTYTDKSSVDDRRLAGRYNWGETLPRLVGTAGIQWHRNAWNLSFDVQYRGGVWVPTYDPGIQDYTDASLIRTKRYVVGNLYAEYDFSASSGRWTRDRLTKTALFLGIQDLWDEDVPFIDLWAQGYDTSSANIRGRYLYGGFRVGF